MPGIVHYGALACLLYLVIGTISASDQLPIVALETDPVENADPAEDHGLLVRELARQGFLIAARDRGALTRDSVIGEAVPTGTTSFRISSHLPWEGPWQVRLVSVTAGAEHEVGFWSKAFEGSAYYDRRLLVGIIDGMEDTEFAKTLTNCGPFIEHGADVTAPDIDQLLQDDAFSVPALFATVRQAHRAVSSSGSARRALEDLAIGYAHLALCTRWHWNAAHIVFTARALLYAQRLCRDGPDARARAVRGYVWALCGFHTIATIDLEAAPSADGVYGALSEVGHALVFFDFDALQRIALARGTCARIADMLLVTALEQSDRDEWWSRISVQTLSGHPQWWCVEDAWCLGPPRQRPRAVSDRCAQCAAAVADISSLPQPVRDLARVAVTPVLHAQLLAAVRKASGEDPFEPSWQCLASIIAEADTVFTHEHLCAVSHDGGDVEELLTLCRPLIEDQRWRSAIELTAKGYRGKPDERDRIIAAVPVQDANVSLLPMVDLLTSGDPGDPFAAQLLGTIGMHADPCAYDQLERWYRATDAKSRARAAYALVSVAPCSPAGRAAMLQCYPGRALDPGGWNAGIRRHPVYMRAIAERYVADDRLSDADACLTALVSLNPTFVDLERLADVRLRHGNRFGWVEAQRAAASCAATAAEARQARTALTQFFQSFGDWSGAIEQSEAAAATGDPDSMVFAADCRSRIGQWTEAEAWLTRVVAAHPERSFEWYWWCLRWQHGDAATVRSLAMQADSAIPDASDPISNASLRSALFHLTNGERDQAERIFSLRFEARHNPMDGIHLALIRQEQRGTAAVGAALLDVELRLPDAIGWYDPVLIGLERWMRDVVDHPKHEIELSPIADYADLSPDPAFIWYVVGRFSRAIGDRPIGDRCLDRAIALHPIPVLEAHAADMLRHDGVDIGSLLQNDRDGRGGDF